MEKPLDMRIQRTYKALTRALLEAMEEMPFEDIRVKDLCERAIIRKSTFYKHFADKYELLAFVVKEAKRQIDAEFVQPQPNEKPLDLYMRLITGLFAFVEKNERIVHSVEQSDNFMLILNILSREVTPSLREKIEEDQRNGYHLPASPEVMAPFFAGAIAESIRHWFTTGKRMDESELKAQLCNIVEMIYRAANPLSN